MTVFAHFPVSSKYFGDGEQQVMVNFRVDDMDELLSQTGCGPGTHRPQARRLPLRPIRLESDPEGNRVELWQPPKGE